MAPVFDLEEDEEVDNGDAVEEVWRFLVEETGGEVEDGLLEGFETVEGDSGVDSGRPAASEAEVASKISAFVTSRYAQ